MSRAQSLVYDTSTPYYRELSTKRRLEIDTWAVFREWDLFLSNRN